MKILELTRYKNITLIFLAVFACGISGCSSQTLYESAKQGAENNCRNQPPSESDRCLENLNKKSYEEYEKDRSGQK